MTLLALLIGCALIIFAAWLVQTFMPPPWKVPAMVVVVVFALVFLLVAVWPGVASIRVR